MTAPSVIKIGGSLLEDAGLRGTALAAVGARFAAGAPTVLVHGGGKRIDAFLAAMGIPRRVHAGLRVTDDKTLEVVVAVLGGLVNATLVAEMNAAGIAAAGLTGADGGTLRAERAAPIDGVDLGHVGRNVSSDAVLVRAMLGAGRLPVVASIASDSRGALLNVNADEAAAALAKALGAQRLVFFTDVEGLLDERGRVIESIRADRARTLLASGAVTGGMRPKLAACLDAAAGGVTEVRIAGPKRHATILAGGRGGTSLVAA